MSDVNVTTEANGRIRIQLGEDINATLPVSVPGVLSAIAKKYPDQIALVSRPGPDGTNTTYTYKLVLLKISRIKSLNFLYTYVYFIYCLLKNYL